MLLRSRSSLLLLVAACSSPSDSASSSPDHPNAPSNGGATSHDAGDAPSAPVPPVTDGGTGATGDDGGAFSPAPHAAFPVVRYHGAPILTAPKVVTITFPNDALAAQLEAFGGSITSTPWWQTVRDGYCEPSGSTCIGDGPAGTSVELKTAPAASYTDSFEGKGSTFQTFLSSLVTAGTLPAPDANTLYLFYVPSTTAITADGDTLCNDFDGYHNWLTLGSQSVPYAIVGECPPVAGEPLKQIQLITLTASHEIAEASTNPIFKEPTSGFELDVDDPKVFGWEDVDFGGEVGDLCQDFFGLGQDVTTSGSDTVQRIWSIPSAAAGHDPCVPAPSGEVYFNAAPSKTFFVLDVGATATFEVDAFSDAPTSDWTLTALDVTDQSTSYLAFSITAASADGSTMVNNGSKAQVSVTLKADPGAATDGEADGVLISSLGNPSAPTAAHLWPIAVMSTADAADAGVSATAKVHRPRRRHGAHRRW